MQYLIVIPLCLICVILGWVARWMYGRYKLTSVEQSAIRLEKESVQIAETKKKEILLEGRDLLLKERQQQEKEARDAKIELQKNERRLLQKEENLDRKREDLDILKEKVLSKEKNLEDRELSISYKEEEQLQEMQRISSLTTDQAKSIIMAKMEDEAKHDALNRVIKIESEHKIIAEKKSAEILVSCMQRLASEISNETTTATVTLPSDDMKGRIIGREGRNIRALETLTGVDIIIDDTPEAVVISCFDPVRKQVAKVALEKLIVDGRIHPARIEEVVAKTTKEIEKIAFEAAENVVHDLGIANFSEGAIKQLGKLHYRTSYGQNVLKHSKEAAVLAGMIASEIGADRAISVRGALLHDIGKGMVTDSDLNHAELGAEFAKNIGEDSRVVNAIHAHHNDIETSCIESIIVQIADAISGARPGARNEFDTYTKRLTNLEEIATSFKGVEKAFAIQAGRELRIIVNNEEVSDVEARDIAKGIATRIETELRYPGRITITTIRETRITEYAR